MKYNIKKTKRGWQGYYGVTIVRRFWDDSTTSQHSQAKKWVEEQNELLRHSKIEVKTDVSLSCKKWDFPNKKRTTMPRVSLDQAPWMWRGYALLQRI